MVRCLVAGPLERSFCLGHLAEETILLCEFDQEKCSAANFKVFQNARYGNCFTFNHGTMGDVVRQTEFTGARFGLKLVLNVNTAEYVGILSPSEGIRVSIHNPYEVSFPESNVSY